MANYSMEYFPRKAIFFSLKFLQLDFLGISWVYTPLNPFPEKHIFSSLKFLQLDFQGISWVITPYNPSLE